MTEDYFWGLTLDSNKKKEVWDPDRNPASGGGDMQGFRGEHTLLVKQIVLGAEAKDGDVNVVEVEAMGYKADVKFPIAVMRGGSTQSQAVLDLLFPDPPVTFHLVKGSGPVHLLGNHTIGTGELVGDDDEDEDLEDELDEEDLEDLEESPERNNIEDKKRKLSQSNSNKKGKKTKVDEAMRTRTIVAHINSRHLAKEIQEELNLFSNHISSMEMKFTACGLLTVNSRLITAALATGTTYLVVLVQFKPQI